MGIWVTFIVATVNHAAVNIGVQTSFQYSAFNSFGYVPEMGSLDHMVIPC